MRIGTAVPAFGRRWWFGERGPQRYRTGGHIAEVPVHQLERCVHGEIPGDREYRVARRVIDVEERSAIVQGGSFELGEIAVAVVRIGKGVVEHRRKRNPWESAVGPVEDIEPDLFLDHADLITKVVGGEPGGRHPAGL